MPSNLKLQAVFNGFQIGSNGISSSSYFIDSSRKPFTLQRKDGKFRFACEVVVSAATQAALAALTQPLEAAFDPSSGKNGSLRVESDRQLYANLDRVAACYAQIVSAALWNTRTVTLTINGATVITFTGGNATAGTTFDTTGTNLQTAQALASVINANASQYVVASVGWSGDAKTTPNVYLQSKNTVWKIALDTNAAGGAGSTTPTNAQGPSPTGFNAVPSISKDGSDDDAACSRRYSIDVVVELPYTESTKNSRSDELVEVFETDSRRQRLKLSGSYTAIAANLALKQYESNVDAWALTVQQALGGSWEGPFDVEARTDQKAAIPTDGSRQIGSSLRFSRTYEQIIYARGLSDDVRLRRQVLKVKFATEAPGDYGPRGAAVARLRRATITYAAAVDKTQTQDLLAIWTSVVKPFLVDEAKKALQTGTIAIVYQEPVLDRAQNRIEAQAVVLGASSSAILESSVATQDEEDAGVQLVAVWNGDAFAKQRYDGPKSLRRMVTQRYMVLGSGAGSDASASGSFGVLSRNQPKTFVLVSESSPLEAGIDNFFGIPSSSTATSGRTSDDEADFSSSGGVPDPAGFSRAFIRGSVVIEPNVLGAPGDPQIPRTRITKTKVYDYFHDASVAPGPSRTPTLNNSGPDGAPKDDGGGHLSTRTR